MNNSFEKYSPLILVADDERVTRMLLRHLLEKDGYEVVETKNGAECLEAYQQKQPDMVLLDAMMPVMDGFTCCRELVKISGSEQIPVLMITALDDQASVDRAFQAGATDYVTKPIHPPLLRQRLRRILQANWAEKALRESEKKYRSLVDNLKEVIFQLDTQGIVTFLNPAWVEMTGFTIAESLNRHFKDFLHLEEVSLYQEKCENLLTQTIPDWVCQLRYLRKDGGFGWMELFGSLMILNDGNIMGISGTLNDITEQKRREKYLNTDSATTHVLAEAITLKEATSNILNVICQNLEWDIGQIWIMDDKENVLHCIESYENPSTPHLKEFTKATKKCTFPSGVGMTGRIWSEGKAVWVSSIAQEENFNFKKKKLAVEMGLNCAFGIPIIDGEEKLGVMTFLSLEIQQQDSDLLQTMVTIGSDLGQFIKRKQVEEELQLLGKLLALRYQSYIVADENLNIISISEGAKQFSETPEEVCEGNDVRLGFPEFYGLESTFMDILGGKEGNFELSGINRFSEGKTTQYINIYFVANQREESLKNRLFIFFEEVSDKMALKQALVQKENEAFILLNKLSAAKEYIDKVISSMADALLVTNADGMIKTVNEAVTALFEYEEDELLNNSINLLLGDEFTNHQNLSGHNLILGNNFSDSEINCLTKTGKEIPVAFSCATIKTDVKEEGFVYVLRDITERKQAQSALEYQNEMLQTELNEAARYVFSLLPSPLKGDISIQQQFVPSLQLGGDAFDYYWLDEDHLVIYLLDVAGHGVKSALLSVSVLNLLRTQSLFNTDFRHPKMVLGELNRVFQMNDMGDDYFTMWYGVFNRKTRQLTYGCAGHPPAILIAKNSNNNGAKTSVSKLSSMSIPIGMIPNFEYEQSTCEIKDSSTLYIFSDGIYEIHQDNGNVWGLQAFVDYLTNFHNQNSVTHLDNILQQIQHLHNKTSLNDDVSLLQIELN
jgi:PAS domain S-box-containing protein